MAISLPVGRAMDETRNNQSSADGSWNFRDSDGNPLWFNYHKIKHKGESLPPVAQAIPAVWKVPRADQFAYYSLRQWIDHGNDAGLEIFLLASIRALRVVAWPSELAPDHNGDKMGICVEVAFDEVRNIRRDDPGALGEVEVGEHFEEFYKPLKGGDYRTHKYIHWVQTAARRAIDREEEKRRKLKTPPKDFDRLFYLGRLRRGRVSRYVLARHDASDPSELMCAREIETAIDEDLKAWITGNEAKGWLTTWLNKTFADPIERRILSLKVAEPWMTHVQIIDTLNKEYGSTYKHDKAQKVLGVAERQANAKLNVRKGARRRASGNESDEPDVEKWCRTLGYHSDVPIGKWQSMSTFELDEDGYKVHRKLTAMRRPEAA